ncbi:nuclear inhibitor of protein phosphatase 1 isoform X1 [Monomorium pharaonis]|uniref:nuclear inhibitor of protein phosphatase 1 isoform X1 n=1 Tax=Monomorium pharaonis TaxID=307658 RepID=UPI001746A34D|nr:nuclear inhibitor of protein phosphatase 1 isoform X1 [Monomorium pharaonis]
MANHYEVPNWAGKPPVGLHLDVLKNDKLIQKLMVDEKKCYLFGRNQQLNDFCIDHASCSRVHAALVYHKHLNRAFLVDLGSTHGTFIGNLRLEAQKPTQLPIDSTFHFGASTRYYIIRERPQTGARPIIEELEKLSEDMDAGGLLGLPETETELDNLTEFNTAHNRRISMLGITDDEMHKPTRKRKKKGITFNDDEEVINPEDVDPSVGRFRNLIQTTVVPKNAYGGRSYINVRRSPFFKTHATDVYRLTALSRSTSRAIYVIIDIGQSVLHGSYVAHDAAWHGVTQPGTRRRNDTKSNPGGGTARARAHVWYNGTARDGTEEEKICQRSMAWEKTDTNASCIIGRITVRVYIIICR